MNLRLTGIYKSYGSKKVIENLNLDLVTGQINGLLGLNGCGKSSLLKIVFGTLKASSGSFFINQDIYKPYSNFASNKIAYLPQENMLPRNIKVRDIIPMIFEDGTMQDRIFYSEGVANFTNKYIHELSHGQRKYLGVLLICNLPHPILLLDEPFSMADPLTITLIKKELEGAKANKIVVVTDHYYHDVMEISDTVYLLKEGELTEIHDSAMLTDLEYTR